MATDRQHPPAGESAESLRRLGKFQIVKKLGAGGMGAVFLATDTELKRPVALKVLPKDRTDNPRLVRRFKAEAQAVATLRHDNIVAIYEAGEIDGYPYLALEYVDGTDLQTLIQKRGVVPPKRSLKIIRQVADALQHAYEKNIVHRDIKPSNLLVKSDGACKLTDLGLARSIDETLDTSITRAGTTVGTVDYISPEQACDSKAADIRSDIYSLGCTWYHMLTGEPPFNEGDLQAKIRAHLNSPPPNPRQLNPNIPEAYVAVMHQMMAKDPRDRYQTPAELIADLDKVAGVARSLRSELFDEPVGSESPEEYEAWGEPPASSAPPSPSKAKRPEEPRPQGKRSPHAALEGEEETPVHVPQKLPIRQRGKTAPEEKSTSRRRRTAPHDLEAGELAVSGAGEAQPRRLPPGRQKVPTSLSIDVDFMRVFLIGGIVLAVLGLFWWAFSRGTSWSTPSVAAPRPDAPAPPPVAPEEPAPPPAQPPVGPPRAEAQILAGDPEGIVRTGIVVAGTDDLENPDSAAMRRLVPDWVYALRHAGAEGLPIVTVSLSPKAGALGSLNAALKHSFARSRVIELSGPGPFPLDPEVLQNVDRVVIRAAEGSQPLVLFRGVPAQTEQGFLHLKGGVLELEGLHLLLASPPDAPPRTFLSVEAGTIVLRRCTATQGEVSGPAILCRAVESNTIPYPARVLLEESLVRGRRLTAVSGRGDRVDVLAAGSLLASGSGPAIDVEVRAAASPTAGAATSPAVGAAPEGTGAAAPTATGSTPPAADRRSAVRLLGSVLVSGGSAVTLRQPSSPTLARCDVLVRRSILVGGGEAVLLDLPDWPVRATSLSGQPRAAQLQWQQERSFLAGWPALVRVGGEGEVETIADAAGWQSFWGAPLETGSYAPEAPATDLREILRIDEQSARALAAHVPTEVAAGTTVGLSQGLPVPPASLERHLLLSSRPQLPAGFVDLGPPEGGLLRVDLRGLKKNLNDYLNSAEVPDRAHVQLTGIGLVGIPPLRLRGKSLRLEFLQGGEGAPLVLRPEAGRTDAPEAAIVVEGGRLDLIGARIQATPSRTRNAPPRLILVREGHLTLRHCWIEGPLRPDAPEEPLVEWVRGEQSANRQFAYVADTHFLGSQPLLAADVDRRLLFVHNSIFATRGEGLILRTHLGAVAVEPAQAGWVVVQNSTFLIGTRGWRLVGNPTGRESPAVHVECTACVFAPAPGGAGEAAVVLAHPERMTADNLFDWWEQRNGYAPGLKRFRQTTAAEIAEPQDFTRDWVAFWTPSRVDGPITGPNGVLFKTLVASLEGLSPPMLELMPTCAAARAAPDGGPIGARVDRIGPGGVLRGTSPPTPGSPSPVAPGLPPRVDF